MCKSDPSKGMLVVSAPKGTTLELDTEDKGECTLKMDASDKGNIKIYSCKLNEGVKEIELTDKPK